MKMKKVLTLSATAATALALTACGSTLSSEEYVTTYSTHFDTLNYLESSSATDSEFFANMVDGLLENDNYGQLVPSLATNVPSNGVLNTDGTQTWTFTIREDVKWLDYKGEEYATVSAHDWVAAGKYVNTPSNNSETQYIYGSFIAGADDYYNALLWKSDDADSYADYGFSSEQEATDAADFDNVGVKASEDGKTLTFTLKEEMPYFLSALTYSCFLPINESYVQSQGPSFGLSEKNILVNGAYLMTQNVTDNRIELTKNEEYWDADEVHIKRIEWKKIPDDNQDPAYSRKLYEAGQISAFTVSENDETGWKNYVTGSDGTGTSDNPANPIASVSTSTSALQYYMLFNFDRDSFSSNTTKTEAQQAATADAILNTSFRQGLVYGIEVMQYLAYYNQSEPEKWAKRTFTVSGLAEHEGKDYVDYIADIYASKNNVSVETAKEILAGGQDSIHDVTKAASLFETAKTELKANGLSDSDFPIILDTIGSTTELVHAYINAMADVFNDEFGDLVKINVITPPDSTTWTQWSNTDLSYDLRVMMGWGPDYADPYTFLSTYVVGGTMVDYSGLSSANMDLQESILGDYTALVKTANAITDPALTDSRYTAFARAEYNLLFESAIIIPYLNVSGSSVVVSNIKPFTAMRAVYGLSGDKFKGMVMLEEACTNDQRVQWEAEYEANRP